MTNLIILFNDKFSIEVSKEFVLSCKHFTNLKDVICPDEYNKIAIRNFFTEKEFKMYINFFENMNNLIVENNAGDKIPYLDYIVNFSNEYIENYTNKSLEPPYVDEVYKIFTELGEENIIKIITINEFYNNDKIIKGVMLCIALIIKKLERPQSENETNEKFKLRKKKLYQLRGELNYIY